MFLILYEYRTCLNEHRPLCHAHRLATEGLSRFLGEAASARPLFLAPVSRKSSTNVRFLAFFWSSLLTQVLKKVADNWQLRRFHSRCVFGAFGAFVVCADLTGRAFLIDTAAQLKMNTHLDHISHFQTVSGTNCSKRWTYRVFIINTRRNQISLDLILYGSYLSVELYAV